MTSTTSTLLFKDILACLSALDRWCNAIGIEDRSRLQRLEVSVKRVRFLAEFYKDPLLAQVPQLAPI